MEAVGNVGGWLGGALAPLMTGLLVERGGSYTLAFAVAAVAAVLSGGCYVLVQGDAYARRAIA